MIKYRNILLIISVMALFVQCRSENAEDYFLHQNNNTECSPLYVTYSEHIDPIFKRSCVDCHMGGAVEGCDLDNYVNTVRYIQNNQPSTKLFDYVKDNTHQGAELDSCEMAKFSRWILNPAP